MKKLLLSFLMVFLALPALADQIVVKAQGATYPGTITDIETQSESSFDIRDLFSMSFSSYNASSKEFRVNAGNDLVITPMPNVTLQKIEFSYTNKSASSPTTLSLKSADGELTLGNLNVTWAGASTSAITINTTKQIKIKYIVITYSKKTVYPTICDTPTFSVEDGSNVYPGNVIKVSCDTYGSTISWTANDVAVEGDSYTVPTDAKPDTQIVFKAKASVKVDNDDDIISDEAIITVTVKEAPLEGFFYCNGYNMENIPEYAAELKNKSGINGGTNNTNTTALCAVEGGFTSNLANITFDANNGSNFAYINKDNGISIYKSNVFTVSVPEGYKLVAIESNVTFNSNLSANKGTINDKIWSAGTDDVNAVEFTYSSSAANWTSNCINTLKVSYAVANTPAAPAVPVIKIDGEDVTDDTVPVKGNEISFGDVEAGVAIYYNMTPDNIEKAPAKAGEETQDPATIDKDGITYTLYNGTPIEIGDGSWKLSYFARANGVDSEVKALSISKTTGIEGVAAEDGEAVWFNLQGVRVAEPQQGIYVRVANGKAAKVVVE